ncbi:MAG TPA: right-handed parallel beta-helix repeat-containing protein [Candidatus Bathyarchaeia archaeon]|nr:right-handed parallel beta-helix repeat-containing protein [Candidatus Bathyarchaeia archaeon]
MVLNKKLLISIITIVLIASTSVLIYYLVRLNKDNENPIDEIIIKGGIIAQDETWSGSILVNESIVIPKGVTLTILPGTHVSFIPGNDYKNPQNYGFAVVGGTLIANGTSTEQIWFTSDADDPCNGDWGGFELYNTNDTLFNYVIIEYAQMGISQFNSKAQISHSIIRWINFEGLYMERSSPIIEYNLLYQNGNHEIALEQYNYDVMIKNNIFAGGHVPFIAIDSNVTLEGNYFYNYNNTDIPAIQAAGISHATVTGNKFDGFDNNTAIKSLDNSTTLISSNNDFGEGFIPIPELGFEDIKHTNLGYTPGDAEDRFLYVFPPNDETRNVVRNIGAGLGFGWAIEYANGYIWKLETGKLLKIDPITSAYTTFSVNSSEIAGPRGFCYDGEYFWENDHTLLKIVKFKVNDTAVTIYDSFPIPESETGGRQGLATDGTYLYITNRGGNKLFELDKNCTVQRTIDLVGIDLYTPFTWNGTHFWAPGGQNKLIAFTKDCVIEGWIYDVAVGISDMSWDGTNLWGIYKTCESWNDAKIFQIEILDDSSGLIENSNVMKPFYLIKLKDNNPYPIERIVNEIHQAKIKESQIYLNNLLYF